MLNVTSRPRGIYLLPNLFTTAGIFAGFFAMVAATKGFFEPAAIAIFIAMITDALDGRVARLTQTQTAFGVQYDSLSDMVSFGIAPALVLYSWALSSLGKFGWLAAFIYTAAGALRLARFNTQVETSDKRYFQGLAIPAAVGIITSIVWFGTNYDEAPSKFMAFIIALVTVGVAGLMVSNIRYRSFKDIDLKGRVRFITSVVVAMGFVFISIDPPTVLLLIFLGYGLSGPLVTFLHLRKARQMVRDRKLRDSLI